MIPRETDKEIVVTVENASVDVAISPPILDGLIVAGVAPEQNPKTLLFEAYDPLNLVLTVKTLEGAVFTISNVVQE